jgi:methyl-accepting chemotaxis protein-1 (serine sensor receptor)
VARIRDGSALAGEAGKTMAEVTQAVARVTDIMSEIAAASAEQSRGIEQVNQAITQMDNVTQQNAALVEEAAAASRSMEDQGQQLNETVAFFQIANGVTAAGVVAGSASFAAPRREGANAAPALGKRVAKASAAPVTAPVGVLAAAGASGDGGWGRF